MLAACPRLVHPISAQPAMLLACLKRRGADTCCVSRRRASRGAMGPSIPTETDLTPVWPPPSSTKQKQAGPLPVEREGLDSVARAGPGGRVPITPPQQSIDPPHRERRHVIAPRSTQINAAPAAARATRRSRGAAIGHAAVPPAAGIHLGVAQQCRGACVGGLLVGRRAVPDCPPPSY